MDIIFFNFSTNCGKPQAINKMIALNSTSRDKEFNNKNHFVLP